MPPDLISNLWDLPGPRQFLKILGQDLLEGISQLVIYPPGASIYGIKHELLRSIERDYFLDVQVLDPTVEEENGHIRDPFSILCDRWPELIDCEFIERALESNCLPDVILVENLEFCQKTIQTAWVPFLKRWVQSSQANGSKKSLVLLLPADVAINLNLPSPDVRLSYMVWAGIPTALEVRLLCRMKTEGLDFEGQWRELILASLAGNDIGLCERLWECVFYPKAVIEALKSFGDERGWNANKMNQLLEGWKPKPPGMELRINPQQGGFRLLSQGITTYSPEYGEEVNSAVLAVLGRKAELNHRIWRAQAVLLLPLIDEVRRRICDHMYENPLKETDREKFQQPLEWGELKNIFQNLPRGLQIKDRWGSGVHLGWWIRNEISHYRPITYKDYLSFCEFSVSVRKQSQIRIGAI